MAFDFPPSLVILAIVCIACVALLGCFRSGTRAAGVPYRAKPLLTAWERRILVSLQNQVPPGLYVCPQVRLADLLTISGRDQGDRMRALNRVASKSLDFVIVDVVSGDAVLAIELDDRSHDRPDRRERDAFVEAVMRQANVPLRRFKPRETVDVRAMLRPTPSVKRGGLSR